LRVIAGIAATRRQRVIGYGDVSLSIRAVPQDVDRR
jgi:hypothetical protein